MDLRHDSDDEYNEDVNVIELVVEILRGWLQHRQQHNNQPLCCRDSMLQGQQYYKELMTCPNETRFFQVARMTRDSFNSLLHTVQIHGGLRDSAYISSGQKLLLLVSVLTGHNNRDVQERFQHSGETVSRLVNDVACCIIRCSHLFLKAPNIQQVPDDIEREPRFRRYFHNCIGAIDGSHVPAVPPLEEDGEKSLRFYNRKGIKLTECACCCQL